MEKMEEAQVQGSDTFVEMVRFHNWANVGLLDFCAAHADEIGDDIVVGTYSDVRDMWIHIALGEIGYLAPFGETLHQELPFEPQRGEFPGFATVRGLLERSGPALLRLARETPGNRIISGTTWDNEPFSLPASVFLCQAIAHAADHRSQIKVALTQAGLEPPEFDLWHFVEAD
jgi:uncharacterized damage-inducible protein DinB